MPEYLSPGVYVEEIDAGAKPIEGVSTSTCGAVGITARGPTTGKPVLVTGFLDFERRFGGFLPEPLAALRNQWANDDAEGGMWWQFPLSVKGFFDMAANGCTSSVSSAAPPKQRPCVSRAG